MKQASRGECWLSGVVLRKSSLVIRTRSAAGGTNLAVRDIPAGDPCSTRVLGTLLVPWDLIILRRHPFIVDDRDFKSKHNRIVVAEVQEALRRTEETDAVLSLPEIRKKSHVWSRGETVEHHSLKLRLVLL